MKRVALITGGCRGIGLGIAKALAGENCVLALTGRKAETDVKPVISDLRAHGTEVAYFQSDVSDDADRKKLVRDAVRHFGHIDVLVNNAGVAPSKRQDLLEATVDSFDWVIDINLKGPYFLTQEVANAMIADDRPNGEKCIINITSISSTVASPSRGDYCISKAGQSMASKLFAVRLAEVGIPVYEIRPGIIATDMTSGVKEKYDQKFEAGLALQNRWGLPDDVGRAVAAFVRGDFPYSTGTSILVDGGMLVERL